ncbi:MAG: GTPase HflX [Nitriliruptorales bacterium]|nr:GTPase HflX [Nitriliruptorales bacterium]
MTADPRPGELSRAELRRRRRAVIEEGAPREGVDIIRPVEQAIVVAVQLPGVSDETVAASLDELEALLDTAGASVVERVVQHRDTPEPATFIGKGKVAELRELSATLGADAVVFDEDLSPAQQRNLEEGIGQKVLDRTIVILDIFAQHATSREGKAQVELAQLTYLLPRLRGWGDALSRQAGGRAAGGAGIGGRGPGETQLEVDRRRLNRRITALRRDLRRYEQTRQTKAAERERTPVQHVALVGYTNAGKSSLLNRLTGAGVLVEDQLFATLDPTVRRLHLPDGRSVALSDTVGFVRKLPHGLIEAFTSTLEESTRADLLLHVVDANHPEALAQVDAVHDVLREIHADDVPALVVLNKSDLASTRAVRELVRHVGTDDDAVVSVSAVTGDGCAELLERVAQLLPDPRVRVQALVPWERSDLVARAHEHGDVHAAKHLDNGTLLDATVPAPTARELAAYPADAG